MSKVKRFSLEERYGYQNRKVIYDKNADNDIELNSIYPIIDLLNKYDKQIAELQKQLKDQPSEIVEKIKEQLIKRLNTIAGYGRMTTDELSFLIETEFGSDLDTILKEYQK